MATIMSCLVFREGQQFKVEGCQSAGAMYSKYSGTAGNKFDLAAVGNLSDKRIKSPISLILMRCLGRRVVFGLLGCTVLGTYMYTHDHDVDKYINGTYVHS